MIPAGVAMEERCTHIACSAALRMTNECGVGEEATRAMAAAMLRVALEALTSLELPEQEIIDIFCDHFHAVNQENREAANLAANENSDNEFGELNVVNS